MSTEQTNVTDLKKPTAADEVRAQIVAVAEKATQDDKKRVSELIAAAKKGKFGSAVFTITPSMAAILFLEHNPHNRDWRADGAKSCREYARRMSGAEWKRNNASIGFYVDAQLEDGQHRLSAAALAGFQFETVVTFGIDRDAIITVDDGLNRHAADALQLDGIRDPKTKQSIIRLAASYMVKQGDKKAALRSEHEIKEAVKANNDLLSEAVEIGLASKTNISQPVLKVAVAQTVAYLMLTGGWDVQRIREKLALFQTGVSAEGEKSPYFVASEVIRKARDRSDIKDRLNTVKEIGVALFALAAAERGVKALNHSALKGAVKKELPSPVWPGEAMSEAA